MKKQNLLKSLVAVVPLVGVLTPLASCTTNLNKEHTQKNTNNDCAGWCPVVSWPSGTHIVKTDGPLPYPDPYIETFDYPIALICNDPAYIVTGVESIYAQLSGGERRELVEGQDYYFDSQSSHSATIWFVANFIDSLPELKPSHIAVKPAGVAVVSYNISTINPIVEADEPTVKHIQDGFVRKFKIKNEFKDKYTVDKSKIQETQIYLGRGQELRNYKQIDIDQRDAEITDDGQLQITFKPGIDLSKFDPDSNNLIFDVPTALTEEREKGAEITLFGNIFTSISNVINPTDKTFSIELPRSYHDKVIDIVKWTTKTEFGQEQQNWRSCNVSSVGNYCTITPQIEESEPINDDIIINIEDVNPFSPEVGTFKNETWENLAFWTNQVYNITSLNDDGKESKLKQIYGLASTDTFVGKERKVTWWDTEHTVVVASTFQLDTVKPGHTDEIVLDDDDVDTTNHAAFTFQFKNILCGYDDSDWQKIIRPFETENHVNSNCWVGKSLSGEGPMSCDIRNFLHDDFAYHLEPGIWNNVKPIASTHFRQSIDAFADSEAYICDTFFIPTALQLNSKVHDPDGNSHKWFTEDNQKPFELYKNEAQTDGECDYRKFEPVSGFGEAIQCWTATCCAREVSSDWSNDVVLNTDGSFGDRDSCDKLGILPCFSF